MPLSNVRAVIDKKVKGEEKKSMVIQVNKTGGKRITVKERLREKKEINKKVWTLPSPVSYSSASLNERGHTEFVFPSNVNTFPFGNRSQ